MNGPFLSFDVSVQKFVRKGTGEKHYRAVVRYGVRLDQGHMMRRRFKRASEARAWGERAARMLKVWAVESPLAPTFASLSACLDKGGEEVESCLAGEEVMNG